MAERPVCNCCDLSQDPSSTVRFDEQMLLKEDYDFTAQHVAKHGCICRMNRLFVKVCLFLLPSVHLFLMCCCLESFLNVPCGMLQAEHYSNEGGAVADRSTPKEQKMIKILQGKWGTVISKQARKSEFAP